MKTPINKFRDYAKKTGQEAGYWAYAAWTAPFVALAVLLGLELIGADDWYSITALTIVVTFIATSVFWWWWAITKIVYIIECSRKVEENFLELSKEIKEIKKDVVSGEWREPPRN
jgi:polyferredoxin